MRERILLFSILIALWTFIYVFQYHVNTIWGLIILLCFMTLYGVYTSLALRHRKRKLKKQPEIINENYKPFVSIMIPAHNEESVITNTVENIRKLTYPNFEIILIDDRSEDNTLSVIKALANKYDNVKCLSRSAEAFPGKSAVLNDALVMAQGEAILVFDADATVEEDFLNKLVPNLEPEDVGAVQARKVIRNSDTNILTKCQNNEYTLDTYLQFGRDAVKGAVELRGNGELIKRKALEDIGGWNNYTITDDLDMATRLHIKGWDIRYCLDAVVYEEGVMYLVPLFRQRRRWLEGTIRRYLEYFFQAIFSKKMSLRAKLDMVIYITQFIMPLWFLFELIIRSFKALTHKGVFIHQEIMSSAIISFAVAFGFFMAIRYSLRRYDFMKRWEAFVQASYTACYMLIIWFPMVLFICGKILFCKKDMNWGKTTHGLIIEEQQHIENAQKKDLQEV
ncbi:MAG: glycosyltransferase family 2 protein [Candidatus Gastranaerophilales bacterium]|nr:glycosyltransferase family 2 protein [Candidatus Gastranaerophilales bacterium]